MNRFEREHMAGVREGLSAGLGILERCGDLASARQLIASELRRAAEVIDRDNARIVRELVASPQA